MTGENTASTLSYVPASRMAGSIAVWTPAGQTPPANGKIVNSGGQKAFGFKDILDIVNPLQHIPIVGDLYRAVTGDTISPSSQVIGDSIYGGVLGGMASVADQVATSATGKDFLGNAIGMVTGHMPGLTAEGKTNAKLAAQEQAEQSKATVLNTTDLGNGEREVEERVSMGDGDRMAGSEIRYRIESDGPDVVVPVGRSPNNAAPSRT